MILYEVMCIAMAVYWEARGEPQERQAAVAWGLYHRTASQQYLPQCGAVQYV